MERPRPETITYFEAAIPKDARAERGQMFGHPCCFVNGNMFYGTFGQSVVVRVGAERAADLASKGTRIFVPREGRPWKEYVQVDAGTMPAAELAGLAREALDHTDALPAKPAKAAKGGAKKATAAKEATAAKRASAARKKTAARPSRAPR